MDKFHENLEILSSLPFDQFSDPCPQQYHALPKLLPKSCLGFANIQPLSPLPYSKLMDLINPNLPSIPPSTNPLIKHSLVLTGDRVIYDISIGSQVEEQPNFCSNPPSLVLGRQIAINDTYICYNLNMDGKIEVLNMKTASRSSLQNLCVKRVTDMAFFANDVHLLASASMDGWVFVWNIDEGPDEKDKPQITGKIIMALQIGDKESVSPRVCWHPNDQGVLVVGIGTNVLKIDLKEMPFSGEEPHRCTTQNLINRIQYVGEHCKEVTDLSMCKLVYTTRLVSASKDGQVKIWAEDKVIPLAEFSPRAGQPVNSVTFLTLPDHSDFIILTTSGPLNQEMMIWSKKSDQVDGTELWHYTQALELKSSAESPVEQAFFSQVVTLPFAESPLKDAGFILIANAKQDAIYVVHIGYDKSPSATRMDYMTEFTVKMPILSGTSVSLPDKDKIVKLYCVQAQVINHYSLDFSQCLPPPMEHISLEDTDSDDSSTQHHVALRSSPLNIKAESGSSGSSTISLETLEKSLKQIFTKQHEMQIQREEDIEKMQQTVKSIETIFRRIVQSVKSTEKIEKMQMQKDVEPMQNTPSMLKELVQDAVVAAFDPFVKEINATVGSLVNRVKEINATVGSLVNRVNQLYDLTAAGANSKADEMIFDLKKELLKLIIDQKIDEAFKTALRNSADASIVSWLCCEVDFKGILKPPCLSQGLLLQLLQRLTFDIDKETCQKLGWIMELTSVINPTDPLLVQSATLILKEVFQKLTLTTTTTTEGEGDRSIILARINSMLESCAEEMLSISRSKFC